MFCSNTARARQILQIKRWLCHTVCNWLWWDNCLIRAFLNIRWALRHGSAKIERPLPLPRRVYMVFKFVFQNTFSLKPLFKNDPKRDARWCHGMPTADICGWPVHTSTHNHLDNIFAIISAEFLFWNHFKNTITFLWMSKEIAEQTHHPKYFGVSTLNSSQLCCACGTSS